MKQERHILAIDDDVYTLEVFDVIGQALSQCQMHTVPSFEKSKPIFETTPMDIVILDILLPEQNGFEICRFFKEHPHTANAYFIFMSAEKHHLLDRLRAYSLSAQDFIVKPFEIEEVHLLLKSKLEYIHKSFADKSPLGIQPFLRLGQFTLDKHLHTIYFDRKTIPLTPMEYELMKFFFEHPNIIWTAKDLMEKLWGQSCSPYQTIDTSSVRTLIRKLRHKLEDDPENPTWLVTVKSGGYLFHPFPTQSSLHD